MFFLRIKSVRCEQTNVLDIGNEDKKKQRRFQMFDFEAVIFQLNRG